MSSLGSIECDAEWRRPSYCSANGTCVEVASTAGGIAVRDSKNPAHVMLRYSADVWLVFVRDLKITSHLLPVAVVTLVSGRNSGANGME
jgi:hypothetical protein